MRYSSERGGKRSPKMAALSETDPCSFSQPKVCAVKNIHLALTVDFSTQVLSGYVLLEATKKAEDASVLVSINVEDLAGFSTD